MTDHQIAEAMRVHGGGFICRLGELFQRADADNRARIKAAWPEYWMEYHEIARLRAERDATQHV